MQPKCDGHCGGGCDPCGRCPEPALSIEALPNNPGILRFSIGGNCVDYDFASLVNLIETDTSLKADIINRVLKYTAERHTDTLTGAELGAILHLGDIGDVDISNLEDNSLLVYKKDSNCGEGCEGINNTWRAWNALDDEGDTAEMIGAYTPEGAPTTIKAPTTNTNQYYQVGWNGANKFGITQPVEFATKPTDSNGKAWKLYMDPTTKRIGYVKENP